ncbi:MAG: LacI family DNA-binding transcriptional regulator [Pseudomonadota bacterium]
MAKSPWPARRVTIKDIALEAAVDPSTVTRALQGSERVKPATRQRIAELAKRMGYVPNMAARTLVTQRSHLLGVAIPDMTNPFFADLARGVEDESAKHRLQVLIRNTEGDEAIERDAIQFFLELKVDGLLVPMARCPAAYYASLGSSIPLVHVNRADTEHFVTCDTHAGSLAVMTHLLDHGHRSIAFITGPSGPLREPKKHAYEQALRDAGIDVNPDYVFRFDGHLDSTTAIAERILAVVPRPTAVFAWNDVCAMGLIRALRNRGIRVPDDMSIAGHDDIALAACYEPALTTVHWPMYELGQQSVRYLYRLREGQVTRQPEIPAPALVVRASTGPVRRK